MTPEERLIELGLTLPLLSPLAGAYLPFRWVGNLLFVSGRGATQAVSISIAGRVCGDISVAEARLHARDAGLQLLSAAKAALGEHPAVINGCSQLIPSTCSERQGVMHAIHGRLKSLARNDRRSRSNLADRATGRVAGLLGSWSLKVERRWAWCTPMMTAPDRKQVAFHAIN